MALTYSAATKTARMQAVADQIDAGAAAGTLQIGTAGMGTVLATITLADPCGTVSGSVLTLIATANAIQSIRRSSETRSGRSQSSAPKGEFRPNLIAFD